MYNGFNIDLTKVPSGVLIRDLFSMLFYIFLSSSGPEPPDAAPGHMQLMQPMLRPAMAIGPHGTLIGGNMLRAGGPGLHGMPAGM